MEIWEVEEGGAAPIEGLLEDGTPDPAYAAALGLVSAPLDRRAAAFTLEYVVWLMLQLPLWIFMVPLLLKLATGRIGAYGFLNHPDFKLAAIMAGVTAVLSLAWCISQLVFHGTKGVTLGKAAFGIRSVNVATLARPGLGAVLWRALVVWGAAVVPFGSVAVLASPLYKSADRGRGWHDKVGKVWLVDVRSGLNPYDEKRMRIARKTHAADPRTERSSLPSLTGRAEYRPGGRLSGGVIGHAEPEAGPVGAGGSLATPASASVASPRPTLIPPPQPASTPPAPTVPPVPSRAAGAPAAAETGPQATPVTVLAFDGGLVVSIDGPVVLGRNPKSPDGAQARPVVIADEQLSRTHLLVRPVGDRLELTDCGSSNGTTVTHQGVLRDLAAHQPSAVLAGDTIQIGQLTATVRLG